MRRIIRGVAARARNLLARLRRPPKNVPENPAQKYSRFMQETLSIPGIGPSYAFATSFDQDSPYYAEIWDAAYLQVVQLARDSYDLIVREGVQGDLVEFGVAEGYWLKEILDLMEARGQIRRTWGFDSFEGLPEPDPATDGSFWAKGQYAVNEDDVLEYVLADRRPHLQLVKGWFVDSFKRPEIQAIDKIAYAKIDCDLYQPAVECLEYLTGRLADGAVLMFDDWTHISDKGETKAFMEWAPTVPQYRFELIGFINWRIFFRVWHREAGSPIAESRQSTVVSRQ